MPDLTDREKSAYAAAANSAVSFGIAEMAREAIGDDVDRARGAFASVVFGALGGCVKSMVGAHKESSSSPDVNEIRSRMVAVIDCHLKDHFPDWHGIN